MARQGGYGPVGGRRSSSAIWQWMLLGLLFGVGCSAVMVLVMLTFEVLTIGEAEPQQVLVEVTSPPDPAAVQSAVDTGINATLQAQAGSQDATIEAIVNATVEAELAGQDAVLVIPTNTPPPTQGAEVAATEETTEEGTGGTDAQSVPQPTEETEPEIDPQLASVISPMTAIQGGTFQMGTTPNELVIATRECTQRDNANCVAEFGEDSIPQHTVTLDDYQIELTEVTSEQYIAFLNSMGPGSHTDGCAGRLCIDTNAENENSSILFDGLNYDISDQSLNNLPAVTVTWYGAQAYCNAIGRRLLTEAEWEYAARGPEGNLYPWGQQWNVGSVDGTQRARTNRPDPDNIGVVDVRSYSPLGDTANGISDMAGNAAEWVSDWYDADWYDDPAASGENPTGPSTGREKVLRGGSWAAVPFFARTVHRQSALPDATEFWIGFRCGDDVEASAASAGDGNLEGLGDLPEEGVGEDSEAVVTESVDARPTVPALPATEAPAVPPAQDGG